ncbi:hypothetical protein AB0G02_29965 [Actinosynnema sp. NPDC023658]|uniref:hypothetical protein n=1 Tax=Actinosynnema sp. NPDC023658 TaxID=3155465 RepID=UPI0033ED7835
MNRTVRTASTAVGSSAPIRRLAALLTGCALVFATAVGTTQVAHADDAPLVVCPGYLEQTIDPGLTVLPRLNTVSVNGRFGPCVNQVIDPDHAFADFTAHASGLLSCTLNTPLTNASGTVRWEDEAGRYTGTSVFSGGITLSQRPLGESVGIVLATIGSGDFAGREIVIDSARLTVDPIQCLANGVRRVAGPGTLEVLPI